GQLVVMIAPEKRFLAHVFERIVHPAHIPLSTKAQTANVVGPRDHRPGGGLLGYRLHIGPVLVDIFVHPPKEIDRFNIFTPAIPIGNPFSLFARVVEVEHRRDGVNPQAVGMITIKPKDRVADEKALYLGATVIKNVALPLGMVALAGVGVFIEMASIEKSQAVLIGGKV